MKRNRILALALGLSMLCACSSGTAETTPTPEPTTPVEETAAPTTEGTEVHVTLMKGPTGLGGAKLMADSEAGETVNTYTFEVLTEATEAVAKLSSGEADIAALPTNLASTLYHKLDGGVELLAINTLGVFYILEKGDTVHSLADLAGKTIHAYGQGANPEYVLSYLLSLNGLTLGEDVTVRWYSSTDELSTSMASGDVDLAMLPVPAATTVLMQNSDVRTAVSLNDEWESAGAEGIMTTGCVVARTEFIEEHPEAVDAFLKEYGESISYMADASNLEEAASLAETYGIVPKAAVAKRALPDANLCFITGDDMMEGIQGYYQVLYQADPSSIGGSIPDGAFYYMYEP